MNIEIDRYISELRNTITIAGLNYDIWWVYRGSDTQPIYLDTMNQYALFFQTSINAHFTVLIVELYKLYETRSDTFNIPSLLRMLKKNGKIDSSLLNSLEDTYKNIAKPLWLKVKTLRNEAYGHRTNKQNMDDIFKEADVKPNDLRDLMEITKELLNNLSHAWDNSSHAFNLGSREDTLRLLNSLRAQSTKKQKS